jgi:hypothetical protein
MPDLASVTERLRVIRRAHRRFMRLWQLEEIFVGPSVLDRVAADVTRQEPPERQGHAHPHPCPERPSPPSQPGR